MINRLLSALRFDIVGKRSASRRRGGDAIRTPYTEVASSYLDLHWYRAKNIDLERAGVDLTDHYFRYGDKEGRQPSFYFDTEHYRANYMHGDTTEIALSHYINIGAQLRHSPNVYFDPRWYLSQISETQDIPDALGHYLNNGWRCGLSPSIYFDVKYYLRNNPDVAEAEIEPLRHYCEFGFREGRQPNPLFDPLYYMSANPDVTEAGFEPLWHYIVFGWREDHRNPSPFFNKRYYLTAKPTSGDPLAHYLSSDVSVRVDADPAFDRNHYYYHTPGLAGPEGAFGHFLDIGRFQGRARNSQEPDQVLTGLSAYVRESKPPRRNLKPSDQLKFRELFMHLDDKDVVSFDIFDTLVERKCVVPTLVFDLVERELPALGISLNQFAKIRIRAELEARAEVPHREITYEEVYAKIQSTTNLSPSQISIIKRLELETERKQIVEKPLGRSLYDIAMRSGKRVVLVSDTYLPDKFIRELLVNCGYENYSNLFVSSRVGCTKHNGSMFEYVMDELKISSAQLLHIGDNVWSDISMAQSHGIKAMLVVDPNYEVHGPTYKRWLTNRSSHDASSFGNMIAATYLRPSTKPKQEPEAEHFARLGAKLLGPIFVAMSLNVLRSVRSHGYERLLFLARDAYYFQKAVEIALKRVPVQIETDYLMASRRVCRFVQISSILDIREVSEVDHFPMSIRDFLEGRFYIDVDDLDCLVDVDPDRVVYDSKNDDQLSEILQVLAPRILKNAADARTVYCGYLEEMGACNANVCVVDIGYRGTMQAAVATLTDTSPGGCYLYTWNEASALTRKGMRYDTVLTGDHPCAKRLNRDLSLLELLVSSRAGTLAGLRADGAGSQRFMFGACEANSRQAAALDFMREGALQLVDDFFATYGSDIVVNERVGSAAIEPFLEFAALPDELFCEVFAGFQFEDKFGGSVDYLIADGDGASITDNVNHSIWKSGAATHWRRKRRLEISSVSNVALI